MSVITLHKPLSAWIFETECFCKKKNDENNVTLLRSWTYYGFQKHADVLHILYELCACLMYMRSKATLSRQNTGTCTSITDTFTDKFFQRVNRISCFIDGSFLFFFLKFLNSICR